MRRLIWVSATIWVLSWFGLYLEIFLWHHVTASLHLHGPRVPPGYPKPQPGEFLISILAGSALAPLVCLIAMTVDWVRRSSARRTGLDDREAVSEIQ
jgi:NADH:ubiquinone oxidoreductase subunit H